MKCFIILFLIVFSIILIPTAYSQIELEFTFTLDKYSYDKREIGFISATTNIPNSEFFSNIMHHPYIGEAEQGFLQIGSITFDDDGIIDNVVFTSMINIINGTYTIFGAMKDYDCERRAVTFQYGEIENKELKDSEYMILDENNNLKYDIEKINTACREKRDYVITHPIMIIDKESYDIFDTIIITGHTENTDIYRDTISYSIVSPYSDFKILNNFIRADDNSNFYSEIDIFDLTDFISNRLVPITSGNYTIEFNHRGGDSTLIPFQITGKIYSTTVTIQTDKSEYYTDEFIIVTGIVNDVNLSKDTTINYDVYHGQEIIESGTTALAQDETFNFIIDTTLWDYTGITTVIVTIQNSTARTGIDYYNTPNMTPKSNYEKIMVQQDMDDEHTAMLDTQDTMMYTQQDEIIQIKDDIVQQQSFIDMILNFLGLGSGLPGLIPTGISIDKMGYQYGGGTLVELTLFTEPPNNLTMEIINSEGELFAKSYYNMKTDKQNLAWVTPNEIPFNTYIFRVTDQLGVISQTDYEFFENNSYSIKSDMYKEGITEMD